VLGSLNLQSLIRPARPPVPGSRQGYAISNKGRSQLQRRIMIADLMKESEGLHSITRQHFTVLIFADTFAQKFED